MAKMPPAFLAKIKAQKEGAKDAKSKPKGKGSKKPGYGK
jgi:hypothetical protein